MGIGDWLPLPHFCRCEKLNILDMNLVKVILNDDYQPENREVSDGMRQGNIAYVIQGRIERDLEPVKWAEIRIEISGTGNNLTFHVKCPDIVRTFVNETIKEVSGGFQRLGGVQVQLLPLQ